MGEAFHQSSFTGIRSLPNSQFGSSGPVGGSGAAAAGPGRVGGKAGGGEILSVPVAAGQRRPTNFSAAPLAFSVYQHLPDEFERERDARRAHVADSKARMGGKSAFKCTALPAVPKSAGSFNEFEYVEDPYEAFNEDAKEQVRVTNAVAAQLGHGPIRAAGKSEAHDQLKARKWEIMRSLTRSLRQDWPDCFARCTEDADGCIQVCFHEGRIMGDVTTYMNQFCRTDIDVQVKILNPKP